MFSEPWHVVVCEDSPSSIRGVRTAVTRLAEWHDVTMTAVGIAHAPENEAVLTGVAEHVVGDVNTGLSLALGW